MDICQANAAAAFENRNATQARTSGSGGRKMGGEQNTAQSDKLAIFLQSRKIRRTRKGLALDLLYKTPFRLKGAVRRQLRVKAGLG